MMFENCVVWYDMVWHGMAWYGMVWYGWHGIRQKGTSAHNRSGNLYRRQITLCIFAKVIVYLTIIEEHFSLLSCYL